MSAKFIPWSFPALARDPAKNRAWKREKKSCSENVCPIQFWNWTKRKHFKGLLWTDLRIDRPADRQRDRQMDRETGRRTDWPTGGLIDKRVQARFIYVTCSAETVSRPLDCCAKLMTAQNWICAGWRNFCPLESRRQTPSRGATSLNKRELTKN